MTSKYQQAALGELFIASTPNPAIDAAVFSQTVLELAIAAARKEIVFIDDQVPDIEVLVRGFGAGKEIVILDSGQDGLRQIADAVAGRTGIDALHIISHGAEGRIALGSTTIDGANLPENGALLQTIGASLAEGADILLYGCKVGAGDGQALVDRLAIATGADVAASDDLTGNAALGGDWRLEIRSGDIETAAVVDPALAALYQHTLAIPSASLDFANLGYFADFGAGDGEAPDAFDDVVYSVGGDGDYQLIIDGETRDVAAYGLGYVTNDVGGDGETMLTFSFGAGNVFTPNSIQIANANTALPPQKLIFQAYDAEGDLMGSPIIVDTVRTGNEVAYTDVSFRDLVGVARLTLKADPSSSGGLMSSLMIGNFVMSDIQPAATAPTVASVSAATAYNQAHTVGDTIVVSVTFDQAVDVTGTPTLVLATGVAGRQATYAGGSGTSVLTFSYTVTAGDDTTDLDYAGTTALLPSGGSIRGVSGGIDAVLALPTPGAIGSLGANNNIVLDTTAPTLVITDNVNAPLKVGESATITFTFSEAVKDFTTEDIKVTGSGGTITSLTPNGTNTVFTATFTPQAGVDNGSATITVNPGVYTDQAGNGGGGNSDAIAFDTRAPSTTVSNVTFSADTGVPGDLVTSVAAQTISGAISADLGDGEKVQVSLDGATWNDATTSGRTWEIAATLALAEGTLRVRVVDAAGNAGPVFDEDYRYDASAPGKPSTPDLTDASDSGDDDQDNITGVTTPTFTGTAEEGATITLYADGEAVGTGTANAEGEWSVTVDEALGGGNYTFTVRATDLAGNQGVASDALAVTIITAAPTTTNLSLSLETDSGVPGDRITNVANQLLQGELSAALAQGEKVQVRIAGGSWQDATPVSGNNGWTLDTTLASGAHDIEVRVVNAIGNFGPVRSYDYELDAEAPTVEIESDKLELKVGETATITFTFSDAPGAAFTEQAIKVNGGTLSEFDGEGLVWTAVFTPDADTNNGTASISIGAALFTDLAGNANVAAVPASLTFDTLRPETSAPVLDALSDIGWSDDDGATANPRPTFTGTAESGATVTLYDDNDNAIGSDTVVNGKWSITPIANLANGKHTISARAVDVNGNESELVAGQEITIDTIKPTVTITSNVDKLKIGETATITFTFSEDPGTTFTRQDITVAGGTLGELEKDGLTFTAVFTPTDEHNATTASITVAADSYMDRAGNNGGPGLTPTLSFDTMAPAAPSVPDLDPDSDTGTSDQDDITGDTTPTFSGTAEAGVTVRLFAGGVEIGSAVATNGNWSITSDVVLEAGEYYITAVATDAFGNTGLASDPLRIEIVTAAPATRANSVKFSADTGASQTDLVTRTAAQTISGTLDADLKDGEYVEVSVDGGATWNTASWNDDTWSIGATLLGGEQEVSVRVVNAIGNPGEAYSRDYHLDTVAPTVTIASNVDKLKGGETATITFTFSEAPPEFDLNAIQVDGGKLGALTGSGLTYSATFTPDKGVDAGSASITIDAGAYADLAGNDGKFGASPTLTFDTLAPDAPAAPLLAAASDTGTVGDGVTDSTTQVIEGAGAIAGAMVRLYNGTQLVGTRQADDQGNWSISLNLGRGSYSLHATQDDEAGNESAASNPLALTVNAPVNPNPNPNPNPQPNPPTVVDGMPVTTTPVTLPGGVRGTTVEVPIVTGGRNETDGQVSLADIPLASSGGQTRLLAQLPTGFGLSTSGGSVGAANGLEFLIASIRAATPSHAPDDQGHLVQNGTSFLQGLSYTSLLVHTVKPVSNPGTTDALVLTGFNPAGGQGTALVIDTAGLANDATMELVDVDFAALVGAATVYTGSNGAILAGDGASQHFTVLAGGNNGVFAGGGSDLLTFAAGAPVDAGSASGRASAQQAAASGATTLHGGQGGDAASFAGVRGDYDIEAHNGYLVVSSKAAPDAKALVVNVEELRFGDGDVAVENGAGLATLAGMYQTVFGRQADLYGFEFWADHRDHGVSWGTIALGLIASSEGMAQHGDFNGDAANDIGLLYQALFNREAEAEGLAFWKAAMEERGMSLEQVATSFVESAEMVGHQRGALDWDFYV